MISKIILSSFLFGQVGITDYHDEGITGEGVSIGLIDTEIGDHDKKSIEVIEKIAPNSDLTYLPLSQRSLDLLMDKDIIVSPLSWPYNLSLPEEHPLLITSAGNFRQGYPAIDERWLSVGAYRYRDICINECAPEIIDFESDADVYGLTNIPTSYGRYGGTSAASVSLAAMTALLMSNDEEVSFSEEPFMLNLDIDEPEENINPSMFTDIENHWAEQAIINQAEKGILTGYTDGSFKPDQPITRAEIAIILERLTDYE